MPLIDVWISEWPLGLQFKGSALNDTAPQQMKLGNLPRKTVMKLSNKAIAISLVLVAIGMYASLFLKMS